MERWRQRGLLAAPDAVGELVAGLCRRLGEVARGRVRDLQTGGGRSEYHERSRPDVPRRPV